jgi:hypothetical protein
VDGGSARLGPDPVGKIDGNIAVVLPNKGGHQVSTGILS